MMKKDGSNHSPREFIIFYPTFARRPENLLSWHDNALCKLRRTRFRDSEANVICAKILSVFPT